MSAAPLCFGEADYGAAYEQAYVHNQPVPRASGIQLEEEDMTVSLKVAAGRMLKWNQKGRKLAQPQRGAFIVRNVETGSCVACKIGLVMIGRYGLSRASSGIIVAVCGAVGDMSVKHLAT